MPTPIVHSIDYQDPWKIFSIFANDQGSIFFDSAQLQESCGRYSFIATDPFIIMSSKNGSVYKNNILIRGNPFDLLKKEMSKYSQNIIPDLPPFQGGVAGYFGYELLQHLEKIPLAKLDDMKFPDMLIGFYDTVIAFDNLEKKSWIFSTGFPYDIDNERIKHANLRLIKIIDKIKSPHIEIKKSHIYCDKDKLWSNFTKEDYYSAVEKVIDYIRCGDIFEANISQRFSLNLPDELSLMEIYDRLRKINPATFSAYLNFSEITLLSASPERFIKLENGLVETRPIKGTIKRGKSKEEDEDLATALLNSEKDRSENIMIVDLLRNDLSRVCESYSVQVEKLCGLETYATVHHLVSVIHGKLKKELHAIDLLCASYPGGSITGAPKIRAMEIIAEIEPTFRGPYCGSIGYIGFNGNMDTAITIRTLCINNRNAAFQVGGAVVYDSIPQQEYEETLTKAHALILALTGKYS